jgi:hypothetical protein
MPAVGKTLTELSGGLPIPLGSKNKGKVSIFRGSRLPRQRNRRRYAALGGRGERRFEDWASNLRVGYRFRVCSAFRRHGQSRLGIFHLQVSRRRAPRGCRESLDVTATPRNLQCSPICWACLKFAVFSAEVSERRWIDLPALFRVRTNRPQRNLKPAGTNLQRFADVSCPALWHATL